MKKIYFFAALAAVALASCSNDETVAEYQGDAISFRPFVNNVTRAASTYDVTSANSGLTYAISKFKVTGILTGSSTKYLDGVVYTSDGSSSPVFYVDGTSATTNKYKNEYYWPATETLDFFAYSYYDGGECLGTTSQIAEVSGDDAYKTFTVTPTPGSDPAHADLVYAYLPGAGKTAYGANGVPLNFRHAESKISVKVQNTATKLKFKVEGWKIAFLDGTGTFTFATTDGSTATPSTLLRKGYWSDNTGAVIGTEYASTFTGVDVAANATTASALDGDFIVVPQALTDNTSTKTYAGTTTSDKPSGAYIAVKLYILDNATNVLLAGGGTTAAPTTIWAIWPISGEWEPGKHYTYTIDLAGGGYYETNKENTDNALDPLLQNAIIKFVDVTVDSWDVQTETPVTGPINS